MADLAVSNSNSDVCEAAVGCISDQNVLYLIARSDNNKKICQIALSKITRQRTLDDISKHSKYESIRKEADRKIATLKENQKKIKVRKEAEKKSKKAIDTPHLIERLLNIGLTQGYLTPVPGKGFNEDLRNIEARKIGQILFDRGGKELMQDACKAVLTINGSVHARELECAWDLIGTWYA